MQFPKPYPKPHPDQPPVLIPGRLVTELAASGGPSPRPVVGHGGASLRVSRGLRAVGLCVWVGAGEGRSGSSPALVPVLAGLPAGSARVGGFGREGRPLTEEGWAWEDRSSTIVLWGCVILLEAIKEMDVHVFFFRKQIMALRPIGRKFEQVS